MGSLSDRSKGVLGDTQLEHLPGEKPGMPTKRQQLGEIGSSTSKVPNVIF